MADKKISALTAATTPLAGTEVLPIVQGSDTVKVAVSNLTAGRAVSATQFTSTVAIGTAPLVVTSTTNVANLNASSLNGATFAAPGTIGGGTAAAANFTTVNATGDITLANTKILRSDATTSYIGLAGGTSLSASQGAAIYLSGNTNAGTGGIYMATGNVAGADIIIAPRDSEKVRISTTGIVTMSAYGAGAATFSATGVISSVSDETWKIKDGIPVNPIEMLKKLEPGYWYYNDEKKEIYGKERQLGFYAQNVNFAIGPEAAPTPESFIEVDEDKTETTIVRPWGYYDRSVLAVTVMSLQKALLAIEVLEAKVSALEAKT